MGEQIDFQGIANYGIYWDRDKVNWWPRTDGIQLLGKTWVIEEEFDENDSTGSVDFSRQSGVYLLHLGQEVMYVGHTVSNSRGGGLFSRLRSHHNDRTKFPLWDRFSWFGFRPVEDGELKYVPIGRNRPVPMRIVVRMVEAVLIEAFRPKLNRQGGPLGDNYGQVRDPNSPR